MSYWLKNYNVSSLNLRAKSFIGIGYLKSLTHVKFNISFFYFVLLKYTIYLECSLGFYLTAKAF